MESKDIEGRRLYITHAMNYFPEMICTINAEGKFIQVSQACYQVLGYTSEELEGQYFKDFIRPYDFTKTKQTAQLINNGKAISSFENCYLHKNGQEVYLSWSAVWSKENNLYFCIARKAFPQQESNLEIRKQEELLHLLAEHGSEMQALLDENATFLYVAGSHLKELGYLPDQLVGINALQLIHPEDLAKVQKALHQVKQTLQPIKLVDFRFKTADGQWRWMEVIASNQLKNPAIKALFISSRDITERKLTQLQLAESEQWLRRIFEGNPDMVLLQDEAGVILDANPAFLAFINKSEQQVINHSLYDFLPSTVIPLFKQKKQDAFSGSKVSFEVDVNFEQQGQKVLRVTKVPLTVGGKIVAVHAQISDITAVTQAQRTIEQQAKKLNTIFESITDAFFTLDKNWNFTYINAEFDRLLQMNRQENIGKNIWSVFPEEVNGIYYQQYHHALETGDSVHFEAYLERLAIWLEVKAFPSEEGLSVYFSDITQQVNAKKELEKLSLVARKTTNSVIITDSLGLTEWVNEGFTHMTGYTLDDIAGKKPGTVLQGPETDPATVKRVREKLKAGIPFTDEILNYKKSGEKFWIYKEITPVLNDAGEITKFIAIQNDVTERRKTEEELQKLSLVASKASNGVMIKDAQGRMEWVNEGFTRMSGYSLEELIGKKPGHLLQGPATDQAEVQRIREKLLEGVPFNSVLINYKKSGEAFWVSMDISPVFDETGKLKQFIAIVRDTTYRKEAEANLLKMSQDLYQHNRDLQQFTYIISHNLRAPVANVLGLTNLLAGMNKESEEFSTSLTFLNESVVRLDNVLKDINQILSLRDQTNVLVKEEIKLAEVWQQALEDLQEPLKQCRGQVNVTIEEGSVVVANRAYIHSIFYNLLSNAIKYRSQKRTLQINIRATLNQEGGTLISFSDNGSGFDMKKAGDDVFKMYKRFHAKQEGKGIGLFLVKTQVEAMGGRIEVNSKVEVGTSFIIYLNHNQLKIN